MVYFLESRILFKLDMSSLTLNPHQAFYAKGVVRQKDLISFYK